MARSQNIRNNQYVVHIVDMLQTIGPVVSKRMFGGYGIFLDGLMFGLIADNTLYFKVDTKNIVDYEAAGLPAFEYSKKGKVLKMSYHQAPEMALEDLSIMQSWAGKAYDAALRMSVKK